MKAISSRQMIVFCTAITVLLALACSFLPAGGPDAEAKAAFEEWARQASIPYKNASYQVIENDGSFATVHVQATLRESAIEGWLEKQADVECRHIGSEWQCNPNFAFSLTQAEQAKQKQAAASTATADAIKLQATVTEQSRQAEATRLALMATQVVVEQNANATATAIALGATATALAPKPTPPPISLYDWQLRQPNVCPSSRGNYGLAYDSRRNAIVMFGGVGSNALLGDTWEWDGNTWAERMHSVAPSARQNPAMVYDSNRGVVVLFGGKDSSGHLNDTWEYNGSSWERINPGTSPSPRRESSMIYDELRKEMMLFGGYDDRHDYGDTWIYDGSAWTQRFPANAPPARRLSAMAYDADRGATVLFGGWVDSTNSSQNDTWEWNGSEWSEKYPSAQPEARAGHALVYHATLKAMLLFGGDKGACTILYQDTWSWDGAAWKKLAATIPDTHSVITAAYFTPQDSILLFGGWAGGNGYCKVTSPMHEYVRKP